MIRGEITAKLMAFGQGAVVTGDYWSCAAVQCGPTVGTARLLLQTTLPFL